MINELAKFHPILFSTPMVQAILEGRKIMTRRIVKPQPNENGVDYMKNAPLGWESYYKEIWKPWKWETEEGESISKQPYTIGQILWVRETWVDNKGELPTDLGFVYKAELGTKELQYSKELGVKWKPSIFMPKAACRIFLEITNVKVERLQDISEEDAKAEGVELLPNNRYKYYLSNYFDCVTAVYSFKTLWQKINGRESWESNPFVWVVSFKKITKPQNFK
jgi:hypothetical protein